MKEVLKDIRSKLEKNLYQCEEHVRLSLVARLLIELGWDIWDPTEVNSEYKPVPTEDYTKVDIAIFQTKYIPAAYIEIKPYRKLEKDISKIEKQLRNYCRDNTAIFAIMTDGATWRFYFPQTAGEFAQKCFKVMNILEDDLDELVESFNLFLSKHSITSSIAKKEAQNYLKLTQKQRAIEDAIPIAKKLIVEPPFPNLTEAIITVVTRSGIDITKDEAEKYLKENTPRPPESPKTHFMNPKLKTGTKVMSRANNKLPPKPEDIYSFTKVKRIFVIDKWYDVEHWSQVKKIVYNQLLDKLKTAVISKSYGISPDKSIYRRPLELNEGYYTESNLSSYNVVWHCHVALYNCDYNPSKNLIIESDK